MTWYVILIQFFVTCFFFFLEALFHFNIGKANGDLNFNKIVLPDAKETLLLGGSIAVCAALSSLVSHIIEKYLVGKSKID